MSYYAGGGDAYGGGSGGGFMQSQAGGSQFTPGGGGSTSKARGNQTLRPVTIKQLLEAEAPTPDGVLKVDDMDLDQITLVGKVRSVTEQATNIAYSVDDGTGVIDVKQWVDADSETDAKKARECQGQYIRVVGAIKVFNNKRHIGTHSVRLVTDYNEVQYHILEAVAVHLHLTRGPIEDSPVKREEGTSTDVVMGGNSGPLIKYESEKKLPPTATATARKIYRFLLDEHATEGIDTSIIQQRTGTSPMEIGPALDELMQVGVAFQTVDDHTVAIM